jgi:hypothetical protein
MTIQYISNMPRAPKKEVKKSVKQPLDCAREVMNYTTLQQTDRFDKPTFDRKRFIEKLAIASPKLSVMLSNIETLDKADYRNDRKLYKHYIFSDVKKGYGAKVIASAMIAVGYTIVMTKKGSRIVLDESVLRTKNESKFAVLSSTALWNTPVDARNTKEVLSVFNERPDNIHGDKFRFVILDSGFKEGVDLFDVKYAHIFEDQKSKADLIQSVGRGTRFCGQRGLKFDKGWKLQVFNYKSYIVTIPRKLLKLQLEKKEPLLKVLQERDSNLKFKLNVEDSLTSTIKGAAVDYELNKNINQYSVNGGYKKYIKPFIVTGAAIAALAASKYILSASVKKQQNKNIEDFGQFVKQFGKRKMGGARRAVKRKKNKNVKS